MNKFEINITNLQKSIRQKNRLVRTLGRISETVNDCADAIQYCDQSFGCIPLMLRQTAVSLSMKANCLGSYLGALPSVCTGYEKADLKAAACTCKASLEPEISEKTASPDSCSSEKNLPKDHPQPDTTCEDTPSAAVSAPGFYAMDPFSKSGYLSAAFSSLLSAFPTLTASGSAQTELPLGNGLSAYCSVSVSGDRDHNDHTRISQAIDANSGLLQEGIQISNDGSSVTFRKDGAAVKVKTDTGTWKIDSTSLSRTSGAWVDQNTHCSFTEKVDKKGRTSFETCVTSAVEGFSVSTTAGVKTSDTQRSEKMPAPVTAADVYSAVRTRQRLQAFHHILMGGILGSPIGSLTGSLIPVPVF